MNMKTIEQLNRDFAIQDQLSIIEGEGGLPFIKIDNGTAAALISIYAGQVLSYRPADEPADLLFLSDQAYYQEGKAIKGGIPVCWPWFGPDPEEKGRPGHGFVRNRPWALSGTELSPEGDTKVVLELTDSDETREILRGDTIIDGLVFIVFDGTGSAVEGSGRNDAGIISRRKD